MKFAIAIVVAMCLVAMCGAAPVQMTFNLEAALNATSPHFEDPQPSGCRSDEQAVQITGLNGDFCSPTCSSSQACPSDLPSGTTAQPQCVLSIGGGAATNCALICDPSGSDACPSNASCKPIQGLGVCTYDD